GDQQAAHREQAAAAARDGLAVFGLGGDGPDPPAPFGDGLFGTDTEQWLTEGCYELYLTWAEAVCPGAAGPEARRARGDEALGLLDRAEQLGLTTRCCCERRAELLQARGDAAGARRQQEEAAAVVPRHLVDHFLLGKAPRRSQDAAALEQAATHLKTVLEQQPNHFWANYLLAGYYLRRAYPARA